MRPQIGNLPAAIESIEDPQVKQAFQLLHSQITIVTRVARGTLAPDQRPRNLKQADAGRQFFSTDFNRGFYWTGSVWADEDGAPPRFMVAYFKETPQPAAGWALCDGRTVTRSTSVGTVERFVTPIVTPVEGNVAWIRL